VKLATLADVGAFRSCLQGLGLELPCEDVLETGEGAPLRCSIEAGRLHIGNRFAIHPMEGWDGELDGNPSDRTRRRWQRFGLSGAKLIWGGEAVAVTPDGRANPNQLMLNENTEAGIAELRDTLIAAHREAMGDTNGLVIGLQLTHSGRYCRPNRKDTPEPRIVFRHPILDRRLNLAPDFPLLSDGDLRSLIAAYGEAARRAGKMGFDFVDIKHCHGYLGHELLGAHTREGDYGGSFENRTRYLREIVQVVRSEAPGLEIGVRLSAFDFIPFRPDPARSTPARPGPGIPEAMDGALPYRYGFGVHSENPTEMDLTETFLFFDMLQELGIRLVNVTAGSPYYNPHIQRPALYPPSDGYQPPEDPLVGVHRQMEVCRELKARYPDLVLVGTAYTYLQEFLPFVAQGAVREGWADCIGLGRMVLSYPELPRDILAGGERQKKRICRTFSDCTTGPRKGLVSGCYPLDPYYKNSPEHAQLNAFKRAARPK
jgi:NADPH2 dehydrogenase